MTAGLGRQARGAAHRLRRPVVLLAIGAGATAGLALAAFGPGVALLAVLAAGAAWASIRAPGVLLAAYLLVGYYKAVLGPLSPVDLTVLLAIANAAQLPIMLLTPFRFRGSRLGLGIWIALAVAVLAGATWAGNTALALNAALVWWLLILLPLAAALRVASELRFVRQFLATLFVLGTVAVVLALPSAFGTERLTVLRGNTIQAAQLALMTALVGVTWVARVAPAPVAAAALVVLPVAVVEAVATGSRGPILSLGVVLCWAVVRRLVAGRADGRHNARVALATAATLVVVVLAIGQLPARSLARFDLRYGLTDSSAEARADLNGIALRMFADAPLVGHGTASFGARSMVTPGLTAYPYPHNDLVQLAAELGLMGAGLFVALAAVALARRAPPDPAVTAVRALCLFLVSSSFFSGDIYTDRPMWTLIVLLLALPATDAVPAVEAARPPRDRLASDRGLARVRA